MNGWLPHPTTDAVGRRARPRSRAELMLGAEFRALSARLMPRRTPRPFGFSRERNPRLGGASRRAFGGVNFEGNTRAQASRGNPNAPSDNHIEQPRDSPLPPVPRISRVVPRTLERLSGTPRRNGRPTHSGDRLGGRRAAKTFRLVTNRGSESVSKKGVTRSRGESAPLEFTQ